MRTSIVLATKKMSKARKVQLLEWERHPDQSCEFRFLVDDEVVKYVRVHKDVLDSRVPEFMKLTSASKRKLPYVNISLPPGCWDEADVTKAEVRWDTAKSRKSCMCMSLWHPRRFDFPGQLKIGSDFKSGIWLYNVVDPDLPTPALAKLKGIGHNMKSFRNESEMYFVMNAKGIAPQFYGHVLERDRPIGYVTQWLHKARKATCLDAPECKRVLQKLHDLGYKHNNIKRANFLIQDDRAYIVNFKISKLEPNAQELQREIQELESCLLRESGPLSGTPDWSSVVYS